MTWWSVTSLRWHYPDQVIRVFSAFTQKGTPSRLVESLYFGQLRGSGLQMQARLH